jgi:putative transposase
VAHRQRRSLNHRCEHSHRPTRQREHRMQGCTSAGHAQRCLSAYGPMAQHVRPRRHRVSAAESRPAMHNRVERWADITGTKRAASALDRRTWHPESAGCCLETRASPTT